MRGLFILSIIVGLLSFSSANAATRHVKVSIAKPMVSYPVKRHKVKHRRPIKRLVIAHRRSPRGYYGATEAYLAHPAGCPRTAFCACGAAVEIFGSPVRSLWPANAWYKFPRSSPRPYTVAVSHHHVFVLRSYVGGDRWLTADFNSGGHLSRLHERSISGWTIVDPRATWVASR